MGGVCRLGRGTRHSHRGAAKEQRSHPCHPARAPAPPTSQHRGGGRGEGSNRPGGQKVLSPDIPLLTPHEAGSEEYKEVKQDNYPKSPNESLSAIPASAHLEIVWYKLIPRELLLPRGAISFSSPCSLNLEVSTMLVELR